MDILLRAIKRTDLPILLHWINDPQLIKYTNYFHPVTEKEHEEWYNNIYLKKDQIIFGIEHVETKSLIGICGLYNIDSISRKSELRIKIGDTDSLGKGYGTIATKLLIKYGFEELNMHKIWLRVLSNNIRAMKSYEKSGFINEGILRDDMYINGKYHDIIIMSVFKKGYEKSE